MELSSLYFPRKPSATKIWDFDFDFDFDFDDDDDDDDGDNGAVSCNSVQGVLVAD